MDLQPHIGLEIHIQLKTQAKMFCGCNTDIWQARPNSRVCPVCLGLPGALPVPNEKAIYQVIKMGLALNCQINRESYFERKNYFYPDLPKGYQISQHRKPFCVDGYLELPFGKVRINDVHLEEDTGKSIHKTDLQAGEDHTLLDFNKSGIPLMEIVSAPDIHSAQEAVSYCRRIQLIVQYLGISDADMEKGNIRLEANISVGKADQLPDYRVEIKNLNSFRFMEQALLHEIERQIKNLEQGSSLSAETRGFDEKKGVTFVQRTKEEAHDYRYFPEPDIPPIHLSEKTLQSLQKSLPELPRQTEERLLKKGLRKDYVEIIIQQPRSLRYLSQLTQAGLDLAEAANLVINQPELIGEFTPKQLVEKLREEESNQITDEERLEEIAQEVIAENPAPVSDYQSGKSNALQYLVGQIMKKTKGKADPQRSRQILSKKLE